MIASQSPTVTRQLPDSCLTAPTVRQYDSTTGPTGPDRTRQLTSMVTVRKTRQYTTGHPTGYDRPRQSRQYDSPTALRQLSDRTRQDPTDTTDPTARAQAFPFLVDTLEYTLHYTHKYIHVFRVG